MMRTTILAPLLALSLGACTTLGTAGGGLFGSPITADEVAAGLLIACNVTAPGTDLDTAIRKNPDIATVKDWTDILCGAYATATAGTSQQRLLIIGPQMATVIVGGVAIHLIKTQ